MSARAHRIALLGLALSAGSLHPAGAQAPVSPQTEECLDCHADYQPGIVADWRASRHAATAPAEGLARPVLERRLSATAVPDAMAGHAVGCFECHGQRPDQHADTFEHFGYRIHTVVSPPDCAACHPVEVDQFARSKKAHALDNLELNPVYHTLVQTVTATASVTDGVLAHGVSAAATRGQTCYACHGARVTVRGMKEVDAGDDVVQVPDLANWPNQGVGRVNPDGSRGACTACHARHAFSIAVARKPFTCAQCHLQPDVPAWEVYRESKHGNIALSEGDGWDWTHVPWRVGTDFRAPTCATCHNSLIVDGSGEVVASRTHDFGARLWVRIFGLIYTHPQPEHGATHQLRNADGQPLPTTFAGQPAAQGLIGAGEQARRRGQMVRLCRTCHSTSWAEGHFAALDSAIANTDRMTTAATQLLSRAWERGGADPGNPFDEPIERQWVRQWLFYANSVRYAAAMGGPSLATFEHGWWDLTENLGQIEERLQTPASGADSTAAH